MISGNGISEAAEHIGTIDVLDLGEAELSGLEERRVVDVGRVILPFVLKGFFSLKAVPSVGSLGDLGIDFSEHLRGQTGGDHIIDFSSGGPDISEKNWLSIGISSNRLSFEVNIDLAGNGIGHNQRRGGEIVSLDKRMHSGFEVSVT